GLGTYLGEEDDATDGRYGAAIVDAANLGCNLFDAAINYRAQRSERVLGHALSALARERHFRRDQMVVCTKGGYIPFDGAVPPDPSAFVRDTYVRPGILRAEDVVGAHAMTPRYLKDQLGRSLANLGLESIDVYYVHNPEGQLAAVPRPEFLGRIRAAFELLEQEVAAGRVGRYGVATWNGFRQPPEARDHLSLAELVREAVAVASASILQGQLSRRLPGAVAEALPGLQTAAARALQFVRSTPGVTAALVGMSSREHVEENLAVARVEPAPAGVDSLFTRR